MEMKQILAWTGAAALTTSFFVFVMWPDEKAAQRGAAEPNLFSFIKPMGADASASGSARPAPVAGVTAAEQAASYAAEQPSLRDVPDATMKVARVQESVQRMRLRGASEDEVYRMRAAELSADAATHLAGMERDENAWKSRVGAYLAERDKLLGSNSGMYPEEALQQLRNARFTADEQKLLATYESAGIPRLTLE